MSFFATVIKSLFLLQISVIKLILILLNTCKIKSRHASQVRELWSMNESVMRLVTEGRVAAVLEDAGGIKSSCITIEDGQVCLHSLLTQPPATNAVTLQVSLS